MKKVKQIGEVLVEIAKNRNLPLGRTLRRCPCIQARLIKEGDMSLDDLTDDEIERLIEWDQEQSK